MQMGMTMQDTEGTQTDLLALSELKAARQAIKTEVGRAVIGQDAVIEHLLIALFARGHSLFVGVPGLAKTLLISSLAQALDLRFSRIQFTPDLMPSDVSGTDVLEEDRTTGKRVFRFIKGPIFCNLLLADEINRTPPKTQAALLQAMQELRVTAAGTTYTLEAPFLVFATQNPIEQEGTYPLPEAQLDRFMFMVDVGYPSQDEERAIVRHTTGTASSAIAKVLSPERIRALQELVLKLPVADNVIDYAVSLARATRPEDPSCPRELREFLQWGAGPRASQYLILGAKARAALSGRSACGREDVAALAGPVLRHRLIRNFQAEAGGVTTGQLIERLLLAFPPTART